MGQVGLGAYHLLIPILKLQTRALVRSVLHIRMLYISFLDLI